MFSFSILIIGCVFYIKGCSDYSFLPKQSLYPTLPKATLLIQTIFRVSCELVKIVSWLCESYILIDC